MDLIRRKTGEASQHVLISMVVCVCVCVCGRQDIVAVCQLDNISYIVNRGTLCLELLLGAVERGSSLSGRRRADGKQKARQIK